MDLLDAWLVPAVDGVAYGLLLFVAAAGMTLAFGAGGILNLAHGALVATGAYLAAALGDGTWTAFALAVAVGILAGAAGGGLLSVAVRPLAGRGHLPQALLTFGIALVATDLLATVFGAADRTVTLPGTVAGSTSLFGHRYPTYRLTLIAIAVLVAVAGYLLLTRTRAGRLVRATVDDRHMVAAIGVNPHHVDTLVLVAAGGLAGLAGAVGAPILGAGPTTANTILLLSLVIVVVGRIGSVPGALVASIGVGQVHTVGVTALPELAPYLLFAGMAVALLLPGRAALLTGAGR